MKTAVIIPARYQSSRLPGKPLLRETGKYLIQHVYEQASQARNIDKVIVATDDSRTMRPLSRDQAKTGAVGDEPAVFEPVDDVRVVEQRQPVRDREARATLAHPPER